MVHNTENGASLQKLDHQKKDRGKRYWILLLLEIEKKESKTLNTFQKLLKQISQSPQYNQSRQRAKAVEEEMFMRTAKNQTYLEIRNTGTIPK